MGANGVATIARELLATLRRPGRGRSRTKRVGSGREGVARQAAERLEQQVARLHDAIDAMARRGIVVESAILGRRDGAVLWVCGKSATEAGLHGDLMGFVGRPRALWELPHPGELAQFEARVGGVWVRWSWPLSAAQREAAAQEIAGMAGIVDEQDEGGEP